MGTSVYEVHELYSGCWGIEESGVRAFLVEGTQRAVLIDSGFGTGDIRAEAEKHTKLPLVLVNTHADRDHTGCNHLFDAAYMHPAEFDRFHTAQPELLAKPLWEGEILDLGGRRLECILNPGHTPGSISLLDEEKGILIGGDSVQAGRIFMFGPGRDIYAYMAGLERLMQEERFHTVYPSHGPLPLDRSIIPQLLEGAGKVAAGKVPGKKVEVHGQAMDVYDVGAAMFIYQPKGACSESEN